MPINFLCLRAYNRIFHTQTLTCLCPSHRRKMENSQQSFQILPEKCNHLGHDHSSWRQTVKKGISLVITEEKTPISPFSQITRAGAAGKSRLLSLKERNRETCSLGCCEDAWVTSQVLAGPRIWRVTKGFRSFSMSVIRHPGGTLLAHCTEGRSPSTLPSDRSAQTAPSLKLLLTSSVLYHSLFLVSC